MKLGKALACLVLVGCGAAPTAPATSVTQSSAASVATPAAEAPKPAAEASAAPAANNEQAAAEAAEPLPKIEFTPAAELRKNTRAKFDAALKAIKGQTSASGVAAILTRSLGKPTWTEEDSKRVWVADDSTKCVRLVLQADGSVDLESLRTTESKMITRSARQNLCTGQIEQAE